jgi:integrase
MSCRRYWIDFRLKANQMVGRWADLENGNNTVRVGQCFTQKLLQLGTKGSGSFNEQVSILLGHSNIKVTQQHYNPWVRDRQLQLEADLQRAWNRDPIVLLNSKAQDAEGLRLPLPN